MDDTFHRSLKPGAVLYNADLPHLWLVLRADGALDATYVAVAVGSAMPYNDNKPMRVSFKRRDWEVLVEPVLG